MSQEQDAHGAPLKPNRAAGLDAGEVERLEQVYGEYAADAARARMWDAARPGNVAIRAEVARRLERAAGTALAGTGAILDVGCGAGYWLAWMRGRGVAAERLHGVDMITARVEGSRRRVPGADVRQGDARRLPFADGSCALVLLFTVLSSQPSETDRVQALREARRVAGPAGLVVVWDLRRTRRAIPAALLRRELGPGAQLASATLAPPIARRLGRSTRRLYPLLLNAGLLRTHWFAWAPGAAERPAQPDA